MITEWPLARVHFLCNGVLFLCYVARTKDALDSACSLMDKKVHPACTSPSLWCAMVVAGYHPACILGYVQGGGWHLPQHIAGGT